jgi:hypothetical protein
VRAVEVEADERGKRMKFRLPNTKLRLVRLLFWVSWGGLMGFPFLAIVCAPFGYTPYNSPDQLGPFALAFALVGLCLTSAKLVTLQPRLARFGMRSIAVGTALFVLTGSILGPVTGAIS